MEWSDFYTFHCVFTFDCLISLDLIFIAVESNHHKNSRQFVHQVVNCLATKHWMEMPLSRWREKLVYKINYMHPPPWSADWWYFLFSHYSYIIYTRKQSCLFQNIFVFGVNFRISTTFLMRFFYPATRFSWWSWCF